MNKIYKIFLYLQVLFWPFMVNSQSALPGWWQIINTEIVFNNKWSFVADVQLRSQKIINELNFNQFGLSINYKPLKDVSILGGLNQLNTYSNGGNFKKPVLSKELRLWEQVAFVNNIGRIRIEHRYRVEHRWRSNGYRNRFRIRLNTIIPINKSTVEKGTLYATLYDEVFISDKLPNYELNRLQGGLGYQFSPSIKLVIAWIRQYSYSVNNNTASNHLLQTTLSLRLKPHLSHHPHHNIISN